MYNPYSNPGPYGANLNPDHDPRMGMSNTQLPFNPPGASASANPRMFSHQTSYRPEVGRAVTDSVQEWTTNPRTNWRSTVNTRDETQYLSAPLSQPSYQVMSQRENVCYPLPSLYSTSATASRPPPRASDSDSSIDGSLNWLRDISRSTSAESRPSSFLSSSSSFPGSSGSQFEHSETAISGLGNYPNTGTPHQWNNPSSSKYGPETAVNLLQHFNLEKDDLELLLTYPENDITPEKLPHIMRQIRINKNKKASATSGDYAKDISLPKQSTSVRDYVKDIPPIPPISSKADLKIEKLPVLPSKVTDYGHTGKYISGAGTETGTMGAITRAIQGIMKYDTGFTKESLPSTVTAATDTHEKRSSRWGPPLPQAATKTGVIIKDIVKKLKSKKAAKRRPLPAIRKPKLGELPKMTQTHFVPIYVPMDAIESATAQLETKKEGDSVPPVPAVPPVPPVPPEPLAQPTPRQFESPMQTNSLTPAMMQDYAATPPKSFPYTCSLCQKECPNMQEWISHQNDPFHIENCKCLCQRFPRIAYRKPYASDIVHSFSESPSPQHRSKSRSPLRHRKRSRSASPPPLSRWPRSRSRSRERRNVSPRRPEERFRDDKRPFAKRERLHRSPPRNHLPPLASRLRSPSRSYERRGSPPRRAEERYHDNRWTSPKRKDNHRSFARRSVDKCLPRRNDDRLTSPNTADKKQTRSSPRRSRERPLSQMRCSPERNTPLRYSPQRYSPKRSTPPRGHDRRDRREREGERSLSHSSREARSPSEKRSTKKTTTTTTTEPRRTESELAQVAKETLEKASVLKTLPDSSDVDSLVKSMMPLLMSQFSKEMGTSTAPSKAPSVKPKKKVVKKTVKPPVKKPSTLVRLGAIMAALSYEDVVTFAEQFGKTKSVILYRQARQAVVRFENAEDAKTLRSMKNPLIKDHPITFVNPKQGASVVKRSLKPAGKKTKSKTNASETNPATAAKSSEEESSQESSPAKSEPEEEMPDSPFTAPETLEELLKPESFKYHTLKERHVLGHSFLDEDRRLVLLTNLPTYDPKDPYTERDLVKRLKPFRFQHEPNNIYILPQHKMAFITMPSTQATQNLVKNFIREPRSYAKFRGHSMVPHVLNAGVLMFRTPFSFYFSLMQLCRSKCEDEGEKTIFITNISDSDEADLRQKLEKIGSVKNYLPLLNKVFVEFETSRDADRLGVYYSLLKTTPSYKIVRMKIPLSKGSTLPPLLAANAMPDASEIVPGVVVPTANSGIPVGSESPFWVTLNCKPFLFPTCSPWFIVPDFEVPNLSEQSFDEPENRTVMLTGLPEECYTQAEVFNLTLPFGKNHSLHYHVIVLPLQKRAFIEFLTAEACADFVKRSLKTVPSLNGVVLDVHYVKSKLFPVSNEEEVYSTFMKLSNNRAPKPHLLEQRLLCVVVREVSLKLISLVMEVVTSATSILGFLPLANRICIEVPDVSVVAKVKERFSQYKPELNWKEHFWSKVISVETAAEFKERIKNPGSTVFHLSKPATEEIKDGDVPGSSTAVDTNQDEAEASTEEKTPSQKDDLNTTDERESFTEKDESSPPTAKTSHQETEEDLAAPEPTEEKSDSNLVPLSPSPEGSLTVGETLDKLFTLDTFEFKTLWLKTIFGQKFVKVERQHMVLCNLPVYDPCDPYTEEDLVKKLTPFGFQNNPNDIYIIPQCKMAFITMPNSRSILDLVTAFVTKPSSHALFRGSQLTPHVFHQELEMEPWGFYCWLMQMCKWKCDGHGERTVFIANISSAVADFKKILEKFGTITNFLPLLNEVFVEFKSNADADRLGVYHSLLNGTPSYEVTRMVFPAPKDEPQAPSQVFRAMPGISERAPGVTVPQATFGIPPRSQSPFWVTMTCRPFLYPTDSPWFNIPAFQTLPMRKDKTERFQRVNKRTIMLTNLPDGGYTQEGIAKLVWPHLQGTNLHSFYYDVIVLPLQRRAFINFCSGKCPEFAEDFFNNGLSLRMTFIQPHYIDHKLFPLSSEEELYTTFMSLSNSRAPEKHLLEERLLCIFVKKFAIDLIVLVMEVVTSATPVLGFLPLANRICVELPYASDVKKVKEKFSCYKPEEGDEEHLWKKVLSLETSAELKWRVKKAGNTTVDLKIPYDAASFKKHTCYHINLGRDEPQAAQKDQEKSSSSSDQHRTSSSSRSSSSTSSKGSCHSTSRSSDLRKHSESSSSSSRSSTSHDKQLEKSNSCSKEEAKENDLAKSGHEESDKSSFKSHENEAKSRKELTEERVQGLKNGHETTEVSGEGCKLMDSVEGQTDSNRTTEYSQILSSCQAGESVDEAIKSGEKGVHLEESFQISDSVAGVQTMEESIDEKLSKEDPSQEKDTSQSESATENMDSLPSTTSKRKRDEVDAETQAVCSKTAKTNDQEGTEQKTFESLESDQITGEDVQKVEDVPIDEKSVQKEEAKVVGEMESKKSEATSTRSARSGPGEEKEKMPGQELTTTKSKAKDKNKSTVATIEMEMDENKVVDLMVEETTKDKNLTRRRSARGKAEERSEDLDLIEDSSSKQDISTRSTREIKSRSVKTESSSDESKSRATQSHEGREGKEVAEAKEECYTSLEPGTCQILDSTEEESVPDSDKSKMGSTSTGDLSNKESTAQSQDTKARGSDEMDLVEEAHTRSLRQTRSSQREGSTPTRRGRTSARETNQEESGTKDLAAADVQESTEQKFEKLPAVEEESTPPAKGRRGRPRKQPQKTAIKSDKKVGTPEKEEGNIDKTENKKQKEQENMPEEKKCIKDASNNVSNITDIKLGQVQEEAGELEKEMVESQNKASAVATVEQESRKEILYETSKQTAMEDQEQSRSLSDQASEEAEDTREAAMSEAEKMEGKTTRTTRSTRSSQVCLSEDIAPKQRTSRRVATKHESKTEPSMEKDEKETAESDKRKHEEGTVGSKARINVEDPDSKRSGSQSPSVPSDTILPPFRPNNPIGQEYVVPKYVFFCNLCSVFYVNETTAREEHCSSRQHYDNVKKHLEKHSQGSTKI